MALTDAQMHALGQAVAIAFTAVKSSARELRAISKMEGTSEAHAVGEVAQIALARAGFVVKFDPVAAKAVEHEIAGGDAPLLT